MLRPHVPCSQVWGPPGSPLSHLVAGNLQWGKDESRGGDGAVRGGGARPQCQHQIRSQRREWKPVVFYTVFGGEKHTFFFGHTFPFLPLLSGMAHSECGIRKLLGEEEVLRDRSLAPRPAVGTHVAGCRRSCLGIGRPTRTTRDQGNQGPRPFLLVHDPGIGSLPHFHLFLTLRTFGTQWNHHFKAKRN